MSNEQHLVQRIDRIGHELGFLREIDTALEVFGATQHLYRSDLVSEEHVREMESSLGVVLPLEYRLFLTRIGVGAGPYYGLWSPDEVVRYAQGWKDDGGDEARGGRPHGAGEPGLAFPVTREEAVASLSRFATSGPYVPVPSGTNGILFVCHHGCSYFSILVATGELTGVMFDYSGDLDDAFPADDEPPTVGDRPPRFRNLNRLPSFLDWYESWIHCAFRGLACWYAKGLKSPISSRSDGQAGNRQTGVPDFPRGPAPNPFWARLSKILSWSKTEGR